MHLENLTTSLPKTALIEIQNLPFPHLGSGKVRELFDLGEHLLIVATDRISAFDVPLLPGIPGKGVLLTQLSLFWFEQTASIVPNHIAPDHAARLSQYLKDFPELIPRSTLVKKLTPLPLEAIVRGYLDGQAWLSYQKTGNLFGHALPKDLSKHGQLPAPLFTPSTKALPGQGHDTPMTQNQFVQIFGQSLFSKIQETSLALYAFAATKVQQANFLLADSKFEFALDSQDNLVLIDELFTPDSSRFYAKNGPIEKRAPFDKQFVRNYLSTLNWDKNPPGPTLPEDVVKETQRLYISVCNAFFDTRSRLK